MSKVDVIIPTYKPNMDFLAVLDALNEQSLKPNKIILINTEESYFNQLTDGTDFWEKYDNCEVHHISQIEFDHGETRNKGVSHSDADYFVMMTMDAVPSDEYLIENLVRCLEKESIAVAYARQLPKDDCNPIERYTRSFNYPEESVVKSEKDRPRMGIKTYFCSDVCAAYKKSVFDELGGFIHFAIFNEDMIYAAKALKAGYKIEYCATARVMHSHNYTAKQQFKRNFDLGVSQTDYPAVFSGLKSEGEGIRMVKKTIKYLSENGYYSLIPKLIVCSGAKWLGYRFGKKYQKLPEKWIYSFTSNPNYWKRKAWKMDIRKSHVEEMKED